MRQLVKVAHLAPAEYTVANVFDEWHESSPMYHNDCRSELHVYEMHDRADGKHQYYVLHNDLFNADMHSQTAQPLPTPWDVYGRYLYSREKGAPLTDDEWREAKQFVSWSQHQRHASFEQEKGAPLTDDEWQSSQGFNSWAEYQRHVSFSQERGSDLTDDEWQNAKGFESWPEYQLHVSFSQEKGSKLTGDEWQVAKRFESWTEYRRYSFEQDKGSSLGDDEWQSAKRFESWAEHRRCTSFGHEKGSDLTDDEWSQAKRYESWATFRRHAFGQKKGARSPTWSGRQPSASPRGRHISSIADASSSGTRARLSPTTNGRQQGGSGRGRSIAWTSWPAGSAAHPKTQNTVSCTSSLGMARTGTDRDRTARRGAARFLGGAHASQSSIAAPRVRYATQSRSGWSRSISGNAVRPFRCAA